jgi:DNA-binding MarR family transcriptional regulator
MADTSLSEKKIGLLVWNVSNFWQSKLRNVLKEYNLSLNEYLILEALNYLESNFRSFSQIMISSYSGINVSVVSVSLKSLEKKNLIKRIVDKDNRKKVIRTLSVGQKLFDDIFPKINQQENDLFDKLQEEKLNFCNSLKLILGKKLRVKAKKNL